LCFPGSLDQATKYSVQENIKTVKTYFATKFVVQTRVWRNLPSRNAPTRLTI